VRKLFATAILTMILGMFGAPLAAQNTPPVYLFLLEGRGEPVGTIHVFSVNTSTGVLTEVPGSPFNAGLIPQSLVVDPTGRFLYVANQESTDVTAFSINASTGALTALPGSPVFIGSAPEAVAVDPTGRFLYVSASSAQGQSIFEFAIDPVAGVLTPGQSSPQAGLYATSITFGPLGQYVYLSTGSPGPGSSNPITICTMDFASGALTPIGASQPAAGGSSTAAVSPGGNFLFSVDSVTSSLDAFAIGSAGTSLTEVTGSPYPVPLYPYSLVVHPSGNFLYVVNENQPYQTNDQPSQYDGSISAFTIDPGSGELAAVTGSPFAAGINPLAVVVDPTGSFAYATSTVYSQGYTGAAQISGYSISSSTGALTPFPGTPWTDSGSVPSTGAQLAISPGFAGTLNPAPMLSSLVPSSATATGTAFTLQVNGADFVPGATVYFEGQPRVTTFVDSTQLNAAILANDLDNGGTAVMFVFNPAPGGGASTSLAFSIFNPLPVISSLSPTSVTAGTGGADVIVTGTGFVTSSVVDFNGQPLQTIFIGTTSVEGVISASLIATPGTATITVANPSNGLPGGGTSNAFQLAVVAPVAPLAATSISPTSATAGSPAFTLTVNGSGFVTASQVSFNLNSVSTTFVSSSQLTATIPASAITTPGSAYVIVTNPGGFATPPLSFAINNPQAGIGAVSPSSSPVGSPALMLSVTGSGFLPGTPGVVGSQVLVNGMARQTTFVSSTLLQATLLASDLAQAGTLILTVVNPLSGGSTPPGVQFAVTDYSIVPPSNIPPITAGQTANIPLTISPMDGAFSLPVTLSVATSTPLPVDATGVFAPSATVTPGGSGQTVTLSIQTAPHTAQSTVRWPRGPNRAVPVACILGMALIMASILKRTSPFAARRAVPQLLFVLLLLAAAGLAACGAVGTGSEAPTPPPTNTATGTPAGSYKITITAVSSGTSHSATFTLTVM
jgi:6-phosphogluconolactonase (cycloisomerase 2 family)